MIRTSVQLKKPDIPPVQNTLDSLHTLRLLNNLELDSNDSAWNHTPILYLQILLVWCNCSLLAGTSIQVFQLYERRVDGTFSGQCKLGRHLTLRPAPQGSLNPEREAKYAP
jgi:hypothetical protein